VLHYIPPPRLALLVLRVLLFAVCSQGVEVFIFQDIALRLGVKVFIAPAIYFIERIATVADLNEEFVLICHDCIVYDLIYALLIRHAPRHHPRGILLRRKAKGVTNVSSMRKRLFFVTLSP